MNDIMKQRNVSALIHLNPTPSKRVLFALLFASGIVGVSFFATRPAQTNGSVPSGEIKAETLSSGKSIGNTEPANGTLSAITDTSGIYEQFDPAVTDGLFPKLLNEYGKAALLEDADEISTGAQERITDDVAAQARKINDETRDVYSAKDFTIDQSVSVKDYFNTIAKITQEKFPDKITDPGYEDEMEVIAKIATQKEDPKLLSGKLQKYQYRYAETTKAFLKVKVPMEAVGVHILFTNSFANVATAISQISAFSTDDPLMGVLGMQNYKTEVFELGNIFKQARDLARKEHIVFSENEPGYELQLYFDRLP